MIHSGLLYRLDISTLEIYKHLALPLCSITFTANSQHFYKYIYVSNVVRYEISFLLKYTLKEMRNSHFCVISEKQALRMSALLFIK